MAGSKGFIFDPQDAYNLLVHYMGGELPLNGVVREAAINSVLPRLCMLLVESEEWENPEPLQIRYEGQRTASWTEGQEKMTWAQREDTPKLQ